MDSSVSPITGPATWSVGPLLLGTATVVTLVTPANGICIEEVNTDHPLYPDCVEATPCWPNVDIDVILDGDILLATVYWEVEMSGTIGNQGHPDGYTKAQNDETLSAFDNHVNVPCGKSDNITASYKISLLEGTLMDKYNWGSRTITVNGTLTCSECVQ